MNTKDLVGAIIEHKSYEKPQQKFYLQGSKINTRLLEFSIYLTYNHTITSWQCLYKYGL